MESSSESNWALSDFGVCGVGRPAKLSSRATPPSPPFAPSCLLPVQLRSSSYLPVRMAKCHGEHLCVYLRGSFSVCVCVYEGQRCYFFWACAQGQTVLWAQYLTIARHTQRHTPSYHHHHYHQSFSLLPFSQPNLLPLYTPSLGHLLP